MLVLSEPTRLVGLLVVAGAKVGTLDDTIVRVVGGELTASFSGSITYPRPMEPALANPSQMAPDRLPSFKNFIPET